MSIVGLLCLLFALVASLLLVLYWVQRREIRSVEQLSQQVQRIAIGGRLDGRVDLQSDQPEISALTTAVNHLLTRVSATNERESARATPKLFAELGDRIHEAVLVHRDVILYANRQFATFVGVDRIELVGRKLGDLVPPEYADLVNENLQRRFAGEPPGAVLDGRDIGTVVFPEAPIKIYVDATPEARARRRHEELREMGLASIYTRVLQDMRERDARDRGRAVAPLTLAKDALVIDSSELDADQVFARALAYIGHILPGLAPG